MNAPLVYRWTGEAHEPLPRFRKDADQTFVIGETYFLGEIEEESEVSRNHQFAWVKDAWANLPEHLADEFPTPDHLRRFALIKGGFFDETRIDCGSNAAALRVAATMKADNPFAAVVVRGPLVVRRVAKSQKRRLMGREVFQASKTAILEIIAEMLGVEPSRLSPAAEGSARSNASEGVGR